MLQWSPMSYSVKCGRHVDCGITGPLVTTPTEKLIDWLVKGLECATTEQHLDIRSPGCYAKKTAAAKAASEAAAKAKKDVEAAGKADAKLKKDAEKAAAKACPQSEG